MEKLPHRSMHLSALASVTSRNLHGKRVTAHALSLTNDDGSSTVTKVVDPSGATAGSYATLEAAIEALAEQRGQTAIITIADGQTLTVSADVDFTPAQLAFSRVILRGGGRTAIVSDTVASTSNAGPGQDSAWVLPVLTSETPAASALDAAVVANDTQGHYFGVRSTDGTTTVVTTSVRNDYYYTSGISVYGDFDTEPAPWQSGDAFVAFTPTSSLVADGAIEFIQVPGRQVEFEELNVSSSIAANNYLVSRLGRLVYRGCVLANRVFMVGTAFTAVGCVCSIASSSENSVVAIEQLRESMVLANCRFDSSVNFLSWDGDTFFVGVSFDGVRLNTSPTTHPSTLNLISSYIDVSATTSPGFFQTIYIGQCEVTGFYQFNSCNLLSSGNVYSNTRFLFQTAKFISSYDQFSGAGLGANPLMTARGSELHIEWVGSVAVSDSVIDAEQSIITEMPLSGGLAGTCGGSFAINLKEGSQARFHTQPTVTGATDDVRLGANGAKSFATIAAGAAAADRNDFASAGTENCAFFIP